MPCSCSIGCGCGTAAACAASTCVGSGIAAANIAAMGARMAAFHRSWYPASSHPGEPTPEEEEEIHRRFLAEKAAEVEDLQGKLARLQGMRPLPLVRSATRLERERTHLEAKIQRLHHDLSILEGI